MKAVSTSILKSETPKTYCKHKLGLFNRLHFEVVKIQEFCIFFNVQKIF